MRFFSSIRARFTGWYLIVLAVLLVSFGTGLYVFLSMTLQRTQDLLLERRAEQLANSREVRGGLLEGEVVEGLGEVIAFFQQVDDRYRVIAARLVEQDLDLAWIDDAFEGNPSFRTAKTPDGTLIRFYISLLVPPSSLPPSLAPPPMTAPSVARPDNQTNPDVLLEPTVVVVGQPIDRSVSALASLRRILYLAIPMALLVSAGGSLFLIRRALKPIDRIVETTRGIEESDLSGRVSIDSDDELGRLARTLNAMLGRLERAFQRQRQFTDDASHELRSPLAVIEAEATLALRKDRGVSEYKESLSTIAEESASMNRLIDQLLALARGDAGEEAMEHERIDLSSLILDTTHMMQPLAEESGLKLTAMASNSSQEFAIIGDETLLRRVLTNLIENAIRHTDTGGEIEVSVEKADSMVEWRIRDTGHGIEPLHLPHIFERFYRADEARSRSSGGSGLGLAICRQIVEAHQGSISVESERNAGTTFIILLPSA